MDDFVGEWNIYFCWILNLLPMMREEDKIKAGSYSICSIGLVLISLSNNFSGGGGGGGGGRMRKLSFQLIHLQT